MQLFLIVNDLVIRNSIYFNISFFFKGSRFYCMDGIWQFLKEISQKHHFVYYLVII
jgi:hypothetical protein